MKTWNYGHKSKNSKIKYKLEIDQNFNTKFNIIFDPFKAQYNSV
jgi:hypothetical protein